ncbi:uncharacterized protein KRP23_1798 [Phytophthora ramorum]|uniref:uncharacterized protein n=1 Tax=Phytophthora ramorum TaxID=164328 RepID=UPI0030AF0611|nr:hypothetical protein KRP23_1798 [Phytophthora ramorum]
MAQVPHRAGVARGDALYEVFEAGAAGLGQRPAARLVQQRVNLARDVVQRLDARPLAADEGHGREQGRRGRGLTADSSGHRRGVGKRSI